MRSVTFLTLGIASFCCLMACSPQDPAFVWIFKTDGRVLSHPVVLDGVVYVGNSNGTFYAIDQANGRQRWMYQSDHGVRGRALATEAIVFFVSGNNVHALQTGTGEELWSHRSEDTQGAEQIDPWDYHTGCLVLEGSTVYAGLGSGRVTGFDLTTGDVTTQIPTDQAAPVRSGLLIDNGMLYFGDWDGRVYAYDLETKTIAWKTATFEERPYQTFGALTAELTVDGDLLFFGARNPELRALNKRTGEVVWTYVEETGGWISGDPIVENGTMYIGGSDNHELFAFEATTGKKLWTFEFTFNNFSRPLIRDDVLFLTTGDAYTVWGDAVGRGFLYAIDTRTGSLLNVRMIGGNSYSSPVIAEGLLFVGSEDSSLYACDVDQLLRRDFDPASIGYNAVRIGTIAPQPLVEESSIAYTVNYSGPAYVDITTLADSTVRHLVSGTMDAGDHTAVWDGNDDNGNPLDDGYYFVKVGSKDYYRTTFIQKNTAEYMQREDR